MGILTKNKDLLKLFGSFENIPDNLKREYYRQQPLTITALEDNCVITFYTMIDDNNTIKEISVSYDGIIWEKYRPQSSSILATFTLYKSQSIYIKGIATALSYNYNRYFNIRGNKMHEASGNPLSLILYDKYDVDNPIMSDFCFYGLFQNDTYLKIAKNLILPTTLSEGCFYNMFISCSYLIEAPELPATTLAKNCYNSMFKNDNALITAPELPATTLVEKCYNDMFNGCKKLNYIKALFTSNPSDTISYTQNWVNNVSSTGTFVKNAEATWDVTGTNAIPSGWTVETATE